MKTFLTGYTKYGLTILICALAFSLSACSGGKPGRRHYPAFRVHTAKVTYSNMPITLDYPGRVKSTKSVQIIARVAGTLEKKYFTEGNYVKKGTLLLLINPDKYKANYDKAKADVAMQEANLNEKKSDWKRTKSLYRKHSVSQKDRDVALSVYKSAKASVLAAKATLESAKIDLDHTQVRATISGMTGMLGQDIGSYVGSSADNSVLTSITQTDKVYVEFSLPDIELLKKRYTTTKGDWAHIADDKLPVVISAANDTYKQNGVLDFLSSTVDIDTASVKARAIFENTNNVLIPGLFVHIKLGGLIQAHVMSIPQVALMQDSLGAYVYIIVKGRAAKAPIKLGNASQGKYIVLSGLKEGDLVITDELTKLRPGMPVIALPSKAPAPQAKKMPQAMPKNAPKETANMAVKIVPEKEAKPVVAKEMPKETATPSKVPTKKVKG